VPLTTLGDAGELPLKPLFLPLDEESIAKLADGKRERWERIPLLTSQCA
jgi:hypothetical protein